MGFFFKGNNEILLSRIYDTSEDEQQPVVIEDCFSGLNIDKRYGTHDFIASQDSLHDESSASFDLDPLPSFSSFDEVQADCSCTSIRSERAQSAFTKQGSWRELLDERPRAIHLLIYLLCIFGAFTLISSRRTYGSHVELKANAAHTADLAGGAPPTCGARAPTLLARGAAAGARGARTILGAGWAGIGSHYCGPPNGRDFAQAPADVLDAACAQHDFCIERSLYPVAAAAPPRALYPVGVVDADRFRRCGIPLQSHRNPGFAGRIAECDRELLDSLAGGFHCAADPDLPKGPWCSSEGLAGRMPCDE
jgi:hypothetical protein